MVADPANPIIIGAITVLGFLVGFSIIIVIIAMVTKRRGDPKRKMPRVADEQVLSETWNGKLLSKSIVGVGRTEAENP